METYLQTKKIAVPIDKLYPDPNNPRLARAVRPGYADPVALFDDAVRDEIFGQLGDTAFGIEALVEAIAGQGWMPIDSILAWRHPGTPDKYVVVEGNRRRLALNKIRSTELQTASKKLDRMKAKPAGYAKKEIDDQEARVSRLRQIVADTDHLDVLLVKADTAAELEHKLPRILAVRHITGAKEWGNYAEDLWLLDRFRHLFEDKHGPDKERFWDADVIGQVAREASLGETTTKRQLKAASWFSHFRAEWEDQLPDGESFEKSDYYLFENISRKPWLRQQFQVGEDANAISEQGETALFKWVFAQPRGNNADSNPNVFYRHENVLLWNQIKTYDDQNSTSFAARFDVENPDEAPTMREVEAEYLTHKARKKPSQVLDALLRQLGDLTAEQLAAEGEFMRAQLSHAHDMTKKFLKMIDAAAA